MEVLVSGLRQEEDSRVTEKTPSYEEVRAGFLRLSKRQGSNVTGEERVTEDLQDLECVG